MIPAVCFELGLRVAVPHRMWTKRYCAVFMSLEYAMERFFYLGRVKGRLGMNTRVRGVCYSTTGDHEKSR